MKVIEERIDDVISEMRKEKKVWTIAEILKKLNMGMNDSSRDRVIKTLRIMESKNKNFTLEKEYWHGLGYYLKFEEEKKCNS